MIYIIIIAAAAAFFLLNRRGTPSKDSSSPGKQEIDPYMLAGLAVLPFLEKKAPFDEWRKRETLVPESLEKLVRHAVPIYQILVYFLLVRSKYGFEVEKLVRANFYIVLDRGGEELGNAVRQIMDVLEQAFKGKMVEEEERAIIGKDGQKVIVPIEMGVALGLLYRCPGSPYYAEKKGDFHDIADDVWMPVAECLEHGKWKAVKYFEPIVDRLVLKPESAPGMRQHGVAP